MERAVRTDDAAGVREEVEFIGDDERLFSCRHVPLEAPVAGLLVCSPLHADFMANYQREVSLSRLLAARGIAVQRFHYRGTGNSDGDPAAITLDAMWQDAARCADAFVDATGITSLAFLGTRWGALVAARVCQRVPGMPLVLWEPTTDPARYFREGFRSTLMRDAKEGSDRQAMGPPMRERLARDGSVDLLGYPLYRALHDSAIPHDLDGVLGEAGRGVLIVQFRSNPGVQHVYSGLAGKLEARGFDVTLRTAGIAESWWFHSDRGTPSGLLFDETAGWLEARLEAPTC